jgi:RHS repeat-associated protein
VSPKEQFTYHNAGVDGVGGSSYIDAVIMRDKDANTAWATASGDGVLEERRVYCQNWRGDVSALITDTGKMVEWVKYSAYGVAMAIPCGDVDGDMDWDATDSAAITGTLDARKDCNLDGTVSAADVTQANSITGGYQTLGRTVMSSTAVANRKGYAGYENDGSIGDQYHVRNRVYKIMLGRWEQRDPIQYRDGIGLYQYVRGKALIAQDPTGLAMGIGTGAYCSVGAPGDGVTGVDNGCDWYGWYDCTRHSILKGECYGCCPQGHWHPACERDCDARFTPNPIYCPPGDSCKNPNLECKTACDLSKGFGISTCDSKGNQISCDCTAYRQTYLPSEIPGRDAISACVIQCESLHQSMYKCTGPGPGGLVPVPGPEDCNRACSECLVNTCAVNCLTCNGLTGDSKELCERYRDFQKSWVKPYCDTCKTCKFVH